MQKGGLTMAVNLDKEAYYRRIKRLYSNWKVIVTDVTRGSESGSLLDFNYSCKNRRTAKLARGFFYGECWCECV